MYHSRQGCAGNGKFTAGGARAVTQQSSGLTLKSTGRYLVQNCNVIYIIDWNCRKNIGSKRGLRFSKLDNMGGKGVHKIGSSLHKQMSKSLVFQWEHLYPYWRNIRHLFWELCISVSLIWGFLGTKTIKMMELVTMAQHPLIFITLCWHKDTDKRTSQFFRSLESRWLACFSPVSSHWFFSFSML